MASELLLKVRIPGPPPTKERARTFIDEKGKSRTVTPKRTRAWEEKATGWFRIAWRGAALKNVPVRLDLTAVVKRPESMNDTNPDERLPYLGTPDIDNILKIVADSLAPQKSNKRVWVRVLANDRFIVETSSRKLYGKVGEESAVYVELWSYGGAFVLPVEEVEVETSTPGEGEEGEQLALGLIEGEAEGRDGGGGGEGEEGDIGGRHSQDDGDDDDLPPLAGVDITRFRPRVEVDLEAPDPGESSSLAQARTRTMLLRDRAGGILCPCCDRLVKRYDRPLDATMARGLIWAVRFYRSAAAAELGVDVSQVPLPAQDVPDLAVLYSREVDGFVHVKEMPQSVHGNGGTFAKLRHWGFLASPEVQHGHTGLWRPTVRAARFVHENKLVPKSFFVYGGHLEGFSVASTTILEALGRQFDLHELLSRPVDPATIVRVQASR